MDKGQKEKIENMYYGQVMENREIKQIKEQKKKIKEREKRIKKINKNKEKDEFDLKNETVIGMTNNSPKRKKSFQSKIDKKERIKIRKKRKIKKIIKWTSLITIIIGTIVFLLVSPIFNIQEIEIIGNKQINLEEIKSLSQISKNENIFKYITKKVELNIKENPYIENVIIKRKIPNKVEIKIEERKCEFNLQFMNEFAYIDKQGHILEIGKEKKEIPTIQGIKTKEEEILPGKRIQEEDLEKLETVNQIINIWNKNNLKYKITNIDITNKLEYILEIEEEKKKIYLGDNRDLSNKILWIQAIIENNKGIEGEIYVNGNLNENFKPRFKLKV